MKTLDRLLYIQGGECFFCRKQLAKADASIEHLVASANGGNNAEDNCVVCCKTLNALLGSKSLKDKIEVILRQKGAFRCPADLDRVVSSQPAAPKQVPHKPPAPKAAPLAPKPSAPKPTHPASNGGNGGQAVSQNGQKAPPKPQPQLQPKPQSKVTAPSALAAAQAAPTTVGRTTICPTCHYTKVPASAGQIDFRCPKCNGAFRY